MSLEAERMNPEEAGNLEDVRHTTILLDDRGGTTKH